mmetsp:Transcript_38012/g.80483  ORF Transcript_38012/g.80483 Transcript_38012/m.80483 type:complete len:325 (+) Transcript_38012:70-1044(+)|eukprot:CAMPEP_0206457636 /NCGR_PEP_ID=MMETSP0324_2-20121206/23088_1 /ASSEMBLY_ACC=CAM_ASM_000836 /TAXON_ID=2866 /ORGANISM="Crypthecodinium cohnii, Strain Seligo" /LENGTH=324 /DNA_ID=CAMNT_0053928813 /DNA_START=70 /DNA_END=1044 /DNA_ORIENTATION=-
MSDKPPAIPVAILKGSLYCGAPFFAYPWKPFFNHVAGQSYERAYLHFRRDHQDPYNLFYHCLCLGFQLGGNYGLLEVLSQKISKYLGKDLGEIGALLPTSTTLFWAWTIVRCHQAPVVVRTAAVACLGLAHTFRKEIAARWKKLLWATGVLEMAAVQVFAINKAKNTKGGAEVPGFNLPQFLALVCGRWGFQYGLETLVSNIKVPSSVSLAVNGAVAAFMLRVCQDPFNTEKRMGGFIVGTPFSIGIWGWPLALLTDQPWLYFFSTGYLASLAQGVAHYYAGEEGTLPQLANVSDEYAHTTFFPNILLHSVWQSLNYGRGPSML